MSSPIIYSGRRAKSLTADGLLLSSGATIDNDGLINYIKNGKADVNTTGWATYADAGGSAPVDGTGGSPASTWTRSTSTPLRGAASYLWTAPAVNTQGEGVSYDFTIDAADQAKPLQICFDLALVSGSWTGSTDPATDSDMTVWIYDITNATLIQPAGRLLDPMVTGSFYKYRGTFQTASNSTSYRLIIHTATSHAVAYTLKFDNFSLGPQVISNGAVVTDRGANPWTPTGSISTNATYTGQWSRVGDRAQGEVQIAFSGANTQGALTVNLPFTIDTTKLVNIATDGSEPLGYGTLLSSGVSNTELVAKYNSTTSLSLRVLNSAGTYSVDNVVNTNTNVPVTFKNLDKINFSFDVPVVGWSSNVQMSSDSDTRVVSARISGTSTSVTSSTPTVVWNTISKDTHGAMSTSTGRYTAPVTGEYRFSAGLLTGSVAWTSTQVVVLYYKINSGSNVEFARTSAWSSATQALNITGSEKVTLNAGDTIEILCFSSVTTTPGQGSFAIERVSGPTQIAASDSVNARYNSSSTSISGSLAVIVYSSKDFDSHAEYSAGTYTIPSPGKYQINAALSYSGTFALNTVSQLCIFKNGSQYSQSFQYAGGAVTSVQSEVSDIVNCNAGDTITIKGSCGATGPSIAASTSANYFSIARVGN